MSSKAIEGAIVQGKEGVGYGEKAEECPEYNVRDGDCVLDGRGIVHKGSANANNNATIVLGRDRGKTGTVLSGYGGKAEGRTGMIDIVAGRMSPLPKRKSSRSGTEYINDPIFTYCYAAKEDIKDSRGNIVNYFTDASRIYISQKTDADFNFRINPGRVNPSPGQGENPASAIVLQSDDLRFVSRRGIKLVTLGSRGYGDIPVQTSLGSRVTKTYGIELLAGNGFDANGEPLEAEPLVKGKALAHCLNELAVRIEEVQDGFFKFMKDQVQLNNLLMNHTHGETFAGAITLWSPSAQGGALGANISAIKNAFSQLHSGMNLMDWRMQWLGAEIKHTTVGETNMSAGASAKFNSKYNSTN
tara:strand:+ start:424 stop:1497 length:1074 start_codon:yes stop_codon:yes gene_type:complete